MLANFFLVNQEYIHYSTSHNSNFYYNLAAKLTTAFIWCQIDQINVHFTPTHAEWSHNVKQSAICQEPYAERKPTVTLVKLQSKTAQPYLVIL